MRKGQEYILNQAIAMKYSENLINILKREDLTINQLLYIYNYYYYQSEYYSEDLIISEILKYINKVKPFISKRNYFVCGSIFPRQKDPLINNSLKNNIIKFNEYMPNNDFEKYYIMLIEMQFSYQIIKKIYNKWKNSNDIDKTIIDNMIVYIYISKMDDFEYYNVYKKIFLYLMDLFIIKGIKNVNHIFSEVFYSIENIGLNENICINKCFITKDNVCNINYKYIFEYTIKKYERINLIYKYINSNSNFQIEEYCNFYNYFGCNYRKPTILSKDLNSYVKLCKKTKNNIIIEKPLNEISIWIDEKYTVRIECIKYYQTHLILNRDRINIYGMQKAMSKKLVIFNSGKIYEELGRTSKLVPISLKKLMDLKNFDNNMSQLIDIILNHAISENKLYEDIIKDFKLSQIIPIKFNDILKYHSKSEYLKDNYVLANSLPIKYNKLNINLSYLILKSYIYVDEKSKQKLLKIKDNSLLKENKYINDTVRLSGPLYKRKVRTFLNTYMNNYFQKIIFSKDFSENTLIIELDEFFNSLPNYQKDYLKEDFSEVMAYLSKNKIITNKDKNYLLNKLSKIINLYIYENFANKSRYKEKINLFL